VSPKVSAEPAEEHVGWLVAITSQTPNEAAAPLNATASHCDDRQHLTSLNGEIPPALLRQIQAVWGCSVMGGIAHTERDSSRAWQARDVLAGWTYIQPKPYKLPANYRVQVTAPSGQQMEEQAASRTYRNHHIDSHRWE
jgi:hypothetical protein